MVVLVFGFDAGDASTCGWQKSAGLKVWSCRDQGLAFPRGVYVGLVGGRSGLSSIVKLGN